MIDHDTWHVWWATLGERIGHTPSENLTATYYVALSSRLTTEQFVRGIQHVIVHHRYNTWPAAALIIEAGLQLVAVEVQAAAAWQQILPLAYGLAPNAPSWSKITYLQLEERCGRAAVLTFRAAGGYERLGGASAQDLQWMRKDFQEQFGTFLAFADEEPNYDAATLPAPVKALVGETAKLLKASTASSNGTRPTSPVELPAPPAPAADGKLTEIPDWRAAMGARPLRAEMAE